jgi:predicted RecA/RadA family phage recombinase
MADIAVTAARVAPVFVDHSDTIIYSRIAAAAITQGQTVYENTAGKVDLCDANASGKEQFRGVALETVGAGQAVDVIRRGLVEGFTLTALAYDALVYQSDTAGAIADAASGTKTIRVGRVVALTEPDSSGNFKKVLWVGSDMMNNW